MVENVTKAVRRKKTVDDKFIDDMYEEVKSLYHLDQGSLGGAVGSQKKDLGPLPVESVIFLTLIVVAWVLIGAFYLKEKLKKSN
jgi:multiple sugar transport system substrate-binding protein